MSRWFWAVLFGIPYAFFIFIFVLGAVYVDPWMWLLVVVAGWIGYYCYDALVQILWKRRDENDE